MLFIDADRHTILNLNNVEAVKVHVKGKYGPCISFLFNERSSHIEFSNDIDCYDFFFAICQAIEQDCKAIKLSQGKVTFIRKDGSEGENA